MRATAKAAASLIAPLVILFAGAGAAQAQTTVLNPRIVEFDPSPDHSALDALGQPVVQRYQLQFYRLGETQPAMTSDLGKPAPEGDGKIRVDFSTRTSPWPPPNGDYQARVAAVGPTGAGQSDTSNPFSFSFQNCTVSLGSSAQSFTAAGGAGTIAVTSTTGCGWMASSSASWVTLAATSGTGSGSLGFTVAANPEPGLRTATLSIAGQAFTITQAAGCSYSLSAQSASLPAGGGSGSVVLTTGIGCTWSTTGAPTWLTLSTASGAGSGTIGFTAAPNNTTSPRSATVVVAGLTVTIAQAAAACAMSLSPSSAVVGGSGGTGSVAITTMVGCTWTAASDAPWISLSSASGAGSASLGYTVARNKTGAARTGTITVGGRVCAITQGVPAAPSQPKKPRVIVNSK